MKKCIDHIRGMEAKKTLKCHENLSSHEQLKKERSRCQTFENRVLNAESANATCIDFAASRVEKSRRSGGLVVSRSNPDSGVFSYRLRYKVKYAV